MLGISCQLAPTQYVLSGKRLIYVAPNFKQDYARLALSGPWLRGSFSRLR